MPATTPTLTTRDAKAIAHYKRCRRYGCTREKAIEVVALVRNRRISAIRELVTVTLGH